MSKLKIAIAAAVVSGLTITGMVAGPVGAKSRVNANPKGTVAFLGPEQFTGRWVKDAQYFKAALKKLNPNIKILEYNANANLTTQQQQADAAVTAGAKVVVLAAVDQNGDAPIVNKLEKAGVKVLAYDRMIQTPKLRAYDSFDNVGVGIEQGSWFKANVKKGTIVEIRGSTTDQNAHLFYSGFCKAVCPLIGKTKPYSLCYSTWTPNWDPPTAGTEMDSAFTKCGKKIAGVYSMNDGMAAAVYASIKNHTTARIPLTGQDAQPDGLGRILLHRQGMTVFKFVKVEATSAAQVAANWIAGKGLPSNYKSNCGADCVQTTGRHVPSALFVPIEITIKNVGLPVRDGFDSWKDVCTSIAKPIKPYCGLPH